MRLFSFLTRLLLVLTTLLACSMIGAEHGLLAGLGSAAVCAMFGAGFLSTRWATGELGANALGQLAGNLILQEALQLTFATRPELKMISFGFQDLDGKVENAKLGQTVYTRTRSIPAVQDFGSASTDAVTTDVPITLSQFKQVQCSFTAAQYNSTDRDLIREQAEPIATAIQNHIIDSVASLWNTTNYSKKFVSSTYTRAGFTLPLTQAMDGTSDATAIPQGDRYAVLSSPYYGLLADPIIVAALNNPANAEAIRTGKLPQVDGLQLGKYPTLADLGTVHRIGFAGTPDATVYAARAPKNPEEVSQGAKFPGVIDFIEDSKTGFRLMVNEWIGSDLSVNYRLCWLQGYAVGNANNGVVLTSA
jgi:hypothetical protein